MKNLRPQTAPGTPFPLGVSVVNGKLNFALFCRHGSVVSLNLLVEGDRKGEPVEHLLPLDPVKNRTGDIWHIEIDLQADAVCYGYRIDGDTSTARGLRFNPGHVLLDPYAKRLIPRQWGSSPAYGTTASCLAVPLPPFDWQDDQPPNRSPSETIIYELHVRGFTRHPSSGVTAPGTYRGLVDKIPYLKELGITAVELLPVTEWDETDSRYFNPVNGQRLYNYWGYNPVGFFALNSGLAQTPENHINEFREMVRSLHRAGIEVILDLVYNHTGESDLNGVTSSFRGIDNVIYYINDPASGDYLNFSGCGNTLNCGHPIVQDLILESLRYWVQEMHIDGFRFDLAAILGRGKHGEVLADPPLLDRIAEDPLLRDRKLIAEAWDASGLYQVGSFSRSARWMEWNGRFRDDLRRFMAEHPGTTRTLATRIAGSSDLYQTGRRGPLNSINFITCHDGFTLYDLVSYNDKHNHANGEHNQDGENHNLSWNSGFEGPGEPAQVTALRLRRMRTFAALLFLSQGVPMITAGDEFARTQQGNNNGWCQDNELGWIDWRLAESNKDLLRFFKECIALRKKYRLFRQQQFFASSAAGQAAGSAKIAWQSLIPGHQDWSDDCRTLAFRLSDTEDQADFFIMVNGSRTEDARFIVPPVQEIGRPGTWKIIIDTAAAAPADFVGTEQGTPIIGGATLTVPAMALIALQTSCG